MDQAALHPVDYDMELKLSWEPAFFSFVQIEKNRTNAYVHALICFRLRELRERLEKVRWPTRDMLQIKKVAANLQKLLQFYKCCCKFIKAAASL